MGGRCRFVQPEIVRLDLSDGEWVDVKRRLNIGETRRAQSSVVKSIRADGRMEPNLEMLGKAQVMAYLVEWSLRDAQGRVVPITTDTQKAAALDLLDEATFAELVTAVEAHIAAQEAASEQEKKERAGANA